MLADFRFGYSTLHFRLYACDGLMRLTCRVGDCRIDFRLGFSRRARGFFAGPRLSDSAFDLGPRPRDRFPRFALGAEDGAMDPFAVRPRQSMDVMVFHRRRID
jgi:hypothetical protein